MIFLHRFFLMWVFCKDFLWSLFDSFCFSGEYSLFVSQVSILYFFSGEYSVIFSGEYSVLFSQVSILYFFLRWVICIFSQVSILYFFSGEYFVFFSQVIILYFFLRWILHFFSGEFLYFFLRWVFCTQTLCTSLNSQRLSQRTRLLKEIVN